MTHMYRLKYMDNKWNPDEILASGNVDVAQLVYRSNLLGADLRITNFGGGNTSCKTMENDPLTGDPVKVLYVKGSGGDLGTIRREGFAALYMDRLNHMREMYKGLEFEDEMVDLYKRCLFDLESRAPSIDTALHAFLPFRHIDHLHPDAVIAIAATKDSKRLTQEIWGEDMGWLPWQRPGFDLGIQLAELVEKHPNLKGIILEGHGLFTWGDTAESCYFNSLEAIDQATDYLEQHFKKQNPFGQSIIESIAPEKRRRQAAKIAPLLRGYCSSENRMVGHFTDAPEVLEFIQSDRLDDLAPLGTSCPDHFLRTKIKPLVLRLSPEANLEAETEIHNYLDEAFQGYRASYKEYYDSHKRVTSPPMRDPNPVVILYPGVGMFTFAKNKQTARVASEFYINAINVMKGAEAVSRYVALPLQEAFDIEYWLLEEAKLKRQPPEKALSRRVAIVTGAGGGIGKAIAHELIRQGAVVVFSDRDEARLKEATGGLSKDLYRNFVSDMTDATSLQSLIDFTSLHFGGVDIVVNSAGLAISKKLEDTLAEDWDTLQNVLVKGQFLLAKGTAKVMRQQGQGGDFISIVSKNALVSGPNNIGYGTAKAAQLHMSRLLAAELGPDKIRVNVVNPDAVIVGSKIWEGKWAEGRAKAYGVAVEDLPAFYAKRTLLNEIILPEDIAAAVSAFLIQLKKSTGNIINVDGGVSPAFPR